MKRWEYLVVAIESTDTGVREKLLDNIGRRGWELVSATGRTPDFNPVLYFKRPIPWWKFVRL